MPKSTPFSNSLLNLIFNAAAISGLATNATTSPLTGLYVALHTANPGTGGAQTTSEAAYTGYARVAVTRTTSGWTAASGGITYAAVAISFPAATGGSETETFFSIGTAATGAGVVLYSGAISPTILISNGVQPVLTAATSIAEA